MMNDIKAFLNKSDSTVTVRNVTTEENTSLRDLEQDSWSFFYDKKGGKSSSLEILRSLA